jgi:ArsR family transcriptional regulator
VLQWQSQWLILQTKRHSYNFPFSKEQTLPIDISEYSDIISLMNMMIILKALANDKRLKILHWLKEPKKHFTSTHCDIAKDGVCVGLIEKKSGLSQSTVSQYLVLLQRAGLITMERRGQWTYCKRNEETIKEFIKKLADC